SWNALLAQAWEDLCRQRLSRLSESSLLGGQGPWGPASRWWRGTEPEWDILSESLDGGRLLLGEAKWSAKPFSRKALERAKNELVLRPAPTLPAQSSKRTSVRVLFVPELESGQDFLELDGGDTLVVTIADLLRS
ncbi:MAG TPA: DUF234 domain-containing protein, partial [Thermoanaerobaculia bacterium]|nr:DUF234 domain-containing protein [Thermoanaerobaculia bacterium]